jgi:deoxyribodipyrimidine photolyase-related protein
VNDAILIFPHQLYKQPEILQKSKRIYLFEDPLYFSQYSFHKQKILLHRASMKYYESYLQKQGFIVDYLDVNTINTHQQLFSYIHQEGVQRLHITFTDDFLLEKRIEKYSSKLNIELIRYKNPNFLGAKTEVLKELGTKKHYLMASFYAKQRKKYEVLVEDNKPVGGKWSFDAENRKKVPKNTPIPEIYKCLSNSFLDEAKTFVSTYFDNNYGNLRKLYFPVTHKDAEQWLDDFLKHRFKNFGTYEDAIVAQEHWLWHSVLTPMLNIGLLSPQQILAKALDYGSKNSIALNNLEGFVRQIIGWREFIRGIYWKVGVKQRTTNHFGYIRKIPASFWTGETGIEPIDQSIKKLLDTGYNHHIERLMIFGNFFLLCEFNPDEVYKWFMEMYVDAYDWVMVPNVYGMTQYADGGLMTTKPYCSSSNYILKMSDYKKGEWCTIWDALYWRFIYVNREEFAQNQRMRMMISLLDRMNKDKLEAHLAVAEEYLKTLDKEC